MVAWLLFRVRNHRQLFSLPYTNRLQSSLATTRRELGHIGTYAETAESKFIWVEVAHICLSKFRFSQTLGTGQGCDLERPNESIDERSGDPLMQLMVRNQSKNALLPGIGTSTLRIIGSIQKQFSFMREPHALASRLSQ